MDIPSQKILIPENTPAIRIDRWLHRQLDGMSRTEIQGLIRSGAITVDGKPVTPNTPVKPDMAVFIPIITHKKASSPSPTPGHLDVLLEDPSFVVINKQAGQVVHPAPGHPDHTVLNVVLHHFPDMITAGPIERPGVVHRLDADTSGVLLFARTTQDLEALQNQFRNRTTGKTYRCVCRGIPNPIAQDVHAPIGRHPVHRQKRAVNGTAAKEAFTHFKMIRGLAQGTAAELEVIIKTGRTHQIRVHLESIHHPVLGDPVYGGRQNTLPQPWPPAPRLLLHAFQLEFNHPRTDERILVEAPVPADYQAYCNHLCSS